MTFRHHPGDETLLRYAAGTLAPGARVVVAVHVDSCRDCQARVGRFEAIGGMLLDDVEPASLAEDSFARTMARIEAGGAAAEPIVLPRAAIGIELPAALDGCGVGPWRWIGPGVRWSRISVPGDASTTVMLLKVAAGRRLPEHTHSGHEFTQVLVGSFSDARGRYGPGDFDEADDEIEHQPIVDPDGECVCLAAVEGRMVLRGLIGRIVQPFMGR